MNDILLVEMDAKTRIQDIHSEVKRDRLAAQLGDPGLGWGADLVRALRALQMIALFVAHFRSRVTRPLVLECHGLVRRGAAR